MTSPTLNGASSGSWTTAISSQAVTLPTHSTGDLLLIVVALNDSVPADFTITVATGWTVIASTRSVASTFGRIQIAYKEATSGAETNPTISWASSQDSGSYAVFSISGHNGSFSVPGIGDVHVHLPYTSGGATTYSEAITNCYEGALAVHLYAGRSAVASTWSSTTLNSFTQLEKNDDAELKSWIGYYNGLSAGDFTLPEQAFSGDMEQVAQTLFIPALGVSPSMSRAQPVMYSDNNAGSGSLTFSYVPQILIDTADAALGDWWFFAESEDDLTRSGTADISWTSNSWMPLGLFTQDEELLGHYSKPSGSETTTLTLTFGGTETAVAGLFLLKACSTDRPFARVAFGDITASASSFSTVPLRTTSANQAHLMIIGRGADNETTTPPAGYTHLFHGHDATNGQWLDVVHKRYSAFGASADATLTTGTTTVASFMSLLLSNPNESRGNLPAQVMAIKAFDETSTTGTDTAYNFGVMEGQFLVLMDTSQTTSNETSNTITTPTVSNVLKLTEYTAYWNAHVRVAEVTADWTGDLVVTKATDPGTGNQRFLVAVVDNADPDGIVAVEDMSTSTVTSVAINFSNVREDGCAIMLHNATTGTLTADADWDQSNELTLNSDEWHILHANDPPVSGGAFNTTWTQTSAPMIAHALFFNKVPFPGGGLFFGSNF